MKTYTIYTINEPQGEQKNLITHIKSLEGCNDIIKQIKKHSLYPKTLLVDSYEV